MSTNLWTASLRRLLADLGVGGTSWTGTRTSGDGIASAITTASLDAITMYVVQELPSALALALGGQQVVSGAWWALAASGSTIQVGDIRVSGSYKFRIMTADTIAGLMLCRIERQA